MPTDIVIASQFHVASELQALLALELPNEIALTSREPAVRLRGMDTTVLVALATGGSHIVIALISGLLNVLQKKVAEPGKVVMRGSDGSALEFPSTMSTDQIEQLLRLHARLSPTRIDIVRV